MLLDCASSATTERVLAQLIRGEPYAVFDRGRSKWHLSWRIFGYTVLFSLRSRSFVVAYAAALVRLIRPQIVLTFVDNSFLFQRVARLFDKEDWPRFLAVQNGVRMLARDNPPGSRRIFHSEFACFGMHDVEQYVRNGADIKNYYPVGSIRDSLYRSLRPTPTLAKRYDLCLISQIKPGHYKDYPQTMRSLEILAAHVRRYCEVHGTSVCVAARRHPERNSALFEWEQTWFEEHVGRWATVIPNDLDRYTSYALVDQSRVSLALHTTALYEGFCRGNRVLSCNFTGDPSYDFPPGEPWALSVSHYQAFEERLNALLHMSDEEHLARAGDWPNRLIAHDSSEPAHEFLSRVIGEAVRGEPAPAVILRS